MPDLDKSINGPVTIYGVPVPYTDAQALIDQVGLSVSDGLKPGAQTMDGAIRGGETNRSGKSSHEYGDLYFTD